VEDNRTRKFMVTVSPFSKRSLRRVGRWLRSGYVYGEFELGV